LTKLTGPTGGKFLTIGHHTYNGGIGGNHPYSESGILSVNDSSGNVFPWGFHQDIVKDFDSTSP
jgi:hypothetical protein